MTDEKVTSNESTKMIWAGRILSAVPVVFLLMSATMKFLKPPDLTETLKLLGWNESTMTYVAVVEILCVVFYVIPKTAFLGAILIAAYLGGATAAHVRVGDPFIIPVLLGVVAWLGLWLRDQRLRDLLPLTR